MVMMGRAQQSPATLMERSRKREILKPSRGAAAKHAPRDSLEPHLAACEAAHEPMRDERDGVWPIPNVDDRRSSAEPCHSDGKLTQA